MSTAPARTFTLEKSFRVGRWLVEPRANRISNAERSHKVEPRVMEVLVSLAENAGETVTRDEMLEKLWANVNVTDDALNRAVSKLRRVLDDDPQAPSAIETIPKIGYRLIAQVTEATAVEEASRPPWTRPRWRWVAAVAATALLGLGWLWRQAGNVEPEPRDPEIRITPLTAAPGPEIYPAFSPDGTEVAYCWKGAGDNWDLYLRQLDSERPRRLTHGPGTDLNPTWSPDGQWIAFARKSEGACGIYAVSALGNREHLLTTCHPASDPDPAWSPDAGRIVFSEKANDAAPPNLVELSLTTYQKRPLASPPADSYGDANAEFSPDGKTLAFVRSAALGVADVYLLPVGGSEAKRLTFDDLKVHGLAWTPDGRHVLYSSNRGGSFSLWRAPVAGGESEWIALAGKSLEAPAVSNRTHSLVYEEWNDETNIWQMDLRQGREMRHAPLIVSTQWEESPEFSPDGARIAFISDRSGAAEVWVCDRDGSNAMRLTHFNGPYVRSPRWSPDGKAIVFDAPVSGNSDVFSVRLEGGPPHRRTTHPAEERAPNWSKDGRFVYFASRRGGSWQVWKTGTEGGEAQPVTRAGGFAASESDDGRWLYFTKHETPGLYRLPAAGGAETLVIPGLQPVDWSNQVVGRDGIYYTDRADPDRPRLAFFAFRTQKTKFIAPIPSLLYKSGLSVSPDGRSLLYTRIEKREADLILVRNLN